MKGYLKKSWNEVKEMLEAKGLVYEEFVASAEDKEMYQAEDYIVVPAYGENGIALNFEAGKCYEYEYLGWV